MKAFFQDMLRHIPASVIRKHIPRTVLADNVPEDILQQLYDGTLDTVHRIVATTQLLSDPCPIIENACH